MANAPGDDRDVNRMAIQWPLWDSDPPLVIARYT